MNYVSIGIETLSKPDFLCSPEDLCGAWLKLTRYCAQVENGGRIADAGTWDERTCLISCGLPLAILKSSTPLWKWEGSELVVAHYPVWSEEKVRRSREGAKSTNAKRWGDKRVSKRIAERHAKRLGKATRSASRDRSFVRNVRNVLNTQKNVAPPPDLKTQWAATRAEIKRLEDLEAEHDGQLSAEDGRELTRLRKQLRDITRQQANAAPDGSVRKTAA